MTFRTAMVAAAALLGFCGAATRGQVTGTTGGGQPFSTVQPSLGLNFMVLTRGIAEQVGEVKLFSANFAPQGYQFANGQSLLIADYPDLFNKLGTTYGGNGVTTFNLPDLRGRTTVGTGSGVGLTPRTLGSTFGSESTALSAANLPAHTHTLSGSPGATGSAGAGLAVSNIQPSMALNFAVSNTGVFPHEGSGNGLSPFFGRMKLFAGATLPAGYLPANGQVLSGDDHFELSALLLGIYGGTPSQNTFALPDVRGRSVMNTGTFIDEESGLPTLTRTLGQRLGAEQVTLSGNQMPAHAHTVPGGGPPTGSTGGGAPHETIQPSIALNYIIALDGFFPSAGSPTGGNESDLSFLGEVGLFAGNFAPSGWAFAQGQLLTINQNQALFQILGSTFGGNGVTTFALPDLRNALPVHAGGSAGSGLTQVLLGQEFGADNVTLSEAQLGPHAHELPEPGAAALLVLGLVGLAARGRRATL